MDVALRLHEAAAHFTALRFADAEQSYRRALEAEPGNVLALNGLGVTLQELGSLDQAEILLTEALHRSPDFKEAHFNLGHVHLEAGHPESALACIEEVLRRDPADADALALFGIALERLGRFGDAEEYLAEAAQFSPVYGVARMLRFSSAFLKKIDAAGPPAIPPATILRSNGGPGAFDAVTLVTSDPVYLRKYGPAFAGSFAHVARPGDLLHLHVLDADAGIGPEARLLLQEAGVAHYCVTGEHDHRFAIGSRARSVWFTCARFLHLAAWLRAYAVPIVVLDIDAALQESVARLIDSTADSDLGLTLRRPKRAPWLDIIANTLVARPTEPAQAYLRLLANYLNHFLDEGDPQWHLDQCALYCTLRMLEAEGRAPGVRWISDATHATVYHVGHSHDDRMADPRYGRFAQIAKNGG
ncbi:MAG: tetratricopeptide repeat protein [Betaproteobacteria bacterium]|nr:tetratricopeptide repeat protein [Betaproteobacteria bacterium]